jgi:hypothetical protein
MGIQITRTFWERICNFVRDRVIKPTPIASNTELIDPAGDDHYGLWVLRLQETPNMRVGIHYLLEDEGSPSTRTCQVGMYSSLARGFDTNNHTFLTSEEGQLYVSEGDTLAIQFGGSDNHGKLRITYTIFQYLEEGDL